MTQTASTYGSPACSSCTDEPGRASGSSRFEKSVRRKEQAAASRRLRANGPSRYPIERSPLWHLRSIHALARLLGVAQADLETVCMHPTYRRFQSTPKPGGRPRDVAQPTGETLRAHYRIATLLDRVQRPDFLHSATRTRSYVTNAKAHVDTNGAVATLDIENFFESTSFLHVKRFFRDELHCANDVARLLATLCTVDGHLPTGSGLSPLLSYFTHRSVFGAIDRLCRDAQVTMTLYVDDITLSGVHATRSLLHRIEALLVHQGLRVQKAKTACVRPGKAAIITGVVRDDGQLRLRNRHRRAIVEQQDRIRRRQASEQPGLMGRLAAARAVDPVTAGKLAARCAPEEDVVAVARAHVVGAP